jgi:hypothetical protein
MTINEKLSKLRRWSAEKKGGLQGAQDMKDAIERVSEKQEEASKGRLREQLAKEQTTEGRIRQHALDVGLASDSRAKQGIRRV